MFIGIIIGVAVATALWLALFAYFARPLPEEAEWDRELAAHLPTNRDAFRQMRDAIDRS